MFDLQLIRPSASTRDRLAFAVAGGLWRASVILQRAAGKAARQAGAARADEPGHGRSRPGDQILNDRLTSLTQVQQNELRVVGRQVRP
ncbi:MAG: hypothetical protein JHD16_02845 [Solirubrobacteraceae bacterium]|nr:hypothetical protein [Solirubrobacteraceae bacterium]